jgi:predicted O-linked N-acetylglucosamine transferase (SPINDLY family)
MSDQTDLLAEAFAHHQRGDLPHAAAFYQRILLVEPSHFDALHLLGVIASQTRDYPRAVALMSKALEVDSRNATAYFNRGSALQELQQFSAALGDYDRAIALNPEFAAAFSNRGVVLQALGRVGEALESCNKAVTLNPQFAEALFNRANALRELEQWDAALECYEAAIAVRSDYAEAHFNQGNLLSRLKRWQAALGSYERAVAARRNFAAAHANQGNVLAKLLRWEEALESFDKAITIRPDVAEAHHGRGNVLRALKRYDESLLSYDRAIAMQPDLAEAFSNRGLTLKELGQLDAALASCNRAIEIEPNLAGAYLNRGVIEKELNALDNALQSYDRAIELKEDYAEAFSNRGAVLNDLKRFEEAIASCNQAIAIDPQHADAFYNRGITQHELKQYEASIESFDRALAAKSVLRYVHGTRLLMKMQICDWREFEAEFADLSSRIERGEPVSPPFPLLALTGSARLHRRAAQIWIREECPEHLALPAIPRRDRREKIRIGYFSADFHAHATTHLMAELLETHDRSRFEITLFSFGPATNDPMRARLLDSGNAFLDVRDKSDEAIARIAREHCIDIAVDLKGFTKDSRTGIFARRAAPLQVNYLGYPGTMAADYIDYLIADPVLIPETSRQQYSEKVLMLPDSYQPNFANCNITAGIPSRAQLGLPREGFVYCCFKNNYKITPDIFDSWMRILKAVEASVLWLFEENRTAANNLRREAGRRGIDAGRLIFARRVPTEEHLARHHAADLFLDTLPYNAHTTRADAHR